MKLHLPTRLRSAVLACFAAVASLSPTLASGVIGGAAVMFALSGQQAQAENVAYSGTIYTFNGFREGASDMAYGKYVETTQAEDGSFTLTGTTVEDASGWANVQAIIVNATPANTFRFTATNGTPGHLNYTFGPMNLGGVIIESGATGWGIVTTSSGGNRTINLGNSNDTAAFSTINENFVLDNSGGAGSSAITVRGAQTWTIAQDKIFTLKAHSSQNISQSGSITIQGGGSAVFSNRVSSSGSISIATDAMADMAAGLIQSAGASLTNAGALTLGGTVKLVSAITNTGTVSLKSDTTFDLSGLTATQVEGQEKTYQYALVSGGTLQIVDAEGNEVTDWTLAVDQIAGITTSGKEWSFDTATGMITYVQTANELTYSAGGDMVWNTSNTAWDGSATFTDGDIVTFSTADANATLESDINASTVTIANGCTVTLSGAHTLTVGGALDIAGGLVIGKGTVISAGSVTMGENATLELQGTDNGLGLISANATNTIILNGGNETQFSMSGGLPITLAGTWPNLAAAVEVKSGSLMATSSNHRFRAPITVHDGAGLQVGNNGDAVFNAEIRLNGNGGWTTYKKNTARGALVGGDTGLNITSTIGTGVRLQSDSSVEVYEGSTLTIGGALYSDGHTLTTVGNGTLALGGNATDSLIEVTEGAFGLTGAGSTNNATINVASGATMKYGIGDGDKSAATGTMSDTTINIEAGAQLWVQHAAANNATAVINLNGGKLTVYDCAAVGAGGTAGEVSFGTLNITADSELMHGWKGMFTANTLMGSGNLTHVTAEGWDVENLVVKFGTVQDYTGTVDLTTDAHATVEVGVIDMSAGLSGSIVDSVTSDSFHKIGEGSFTLGGLTARELLHMNYEGSLTLTNGLTVADGTVLSYGTSPLGQVLNVDTIEEEATSLVLDLFAITDVNDLNDLNLGISTGISKGYLTVLGLADYSINEGSDGFWHLTATQLAESDWDKNWGGMTLAKAPTSLPAVNLTTADSYSGFASNLSEDGSQVAFQLTGTAEGVTANVYGGSLTGAVTLANGIWIDVEGGNYNAIVGGNCCSNWSGGSAYSLVADTHILMKGGTTGLVIGGNQQDGQSPVMTGDTYISIMEGAEVTGAIIGSGVNHHTATTTQKGNTNIFVYAVLGDNSYANGTLLQLASVNGSIVGGSALIANTSPSGAGVLEGDTNITIDLTNATVAEGDNTFAKRIVGGHSYGAGSCTATLKGSTHVAIHGTDEITFSSMVIGGSYMAGGTSTITGSSDIAISGGVFSGAVIGGSYHSAADGTLTQGGSSIEISGGTFNDWVIGGHYNACQANVRSSQAMGTTSVTLAGGTAANVLGGNYILNAAYPHSSTVESSNIHISDEAAVTGNVVGGTYVGGASGAWLDNVSVGAVHIVMDGGTVNTIYGGSQVLRQAESQKVVQGDISITLEGGTVNGSVYAAGCQQGSSHMETDSTTVNIGSGVTLASGSTVSGGYSATGTCTSIFTGEGDRTLAFATENATYANTTGVSFKDFNKVSVAAGSSVEISGIAAETTTIDMLTKTGAGSLALNAATQTAVTVEEGTLAVKGANTLTAVTVNSGASIDGTADGAVLGGSLTLGAGAGVSLGNNGLALGGTDSVLTLGGVSSLATSALTGTPDGRTVITLFENVADVIGKDGISIKDALSAAADGGIAVSEYFTVAGFDGWTDDVKAAAKLVMEGTALKLSFAGIATPEWTWEGGASGAWTQAGSDPAANWEATDGTTDGQDVYFSASGAGADGSGTVTVSGEVTPASIRIVSGDYTFVSDTATPGSIKLQATGDSEYQGQLLITGNGTAVKLNMANAELGGTTVLEGGTLTLGNNDALGSTTKASLKFNGGSLAYADGITADISSQISADSTATVKVDVAGNNVTWATPGTALGKGIEKSGEGTLTLVGGSSAVTTAAVQAINAGTLALTGGNIKLNGGVTGTGTLSVDANGGYQIGGDNSGFEGTILLGGATDQDVVFATAASAGGANTTLELAGHRFYVAQNSGNVEIASKVLVSEDTVMNGYQQASYTFSNTIEGNGGLAICFGQTNTPVITVTGDMSNYTGTLTLGTTEAAKPLFTVENAAGVSNDATIAGYGTLKMGMEGDANLGATLTGGVGLTGGNGLLTITGNSNTATGALTAGAGGVQLGTADTAANWAGNSLAGGTLTVVNGTLSGISDKAAGATLDVVAAANTTVHTGTTAGALIDSITLTADGAKLDMDVDALAVGGDGNPTLSVKLSTGNIGSADPLGGAPTEGDAIILLNEGGTLTVNEADIDISNQSVIDLIVANKTGMKNSLLTLTNGTLAYGGTDSAYAGFGLNDKLSQYGLRVEGVSGGSIVLNGDTTGVYLVTGDPDVSDPHAVDNAGTLGMYSAVVIDKNQTLNLNLDTPDTAAVNNLTGGAGSKLVVSNTGDTELNIELSNYPVDETGGDPASIGAETIMEGGVLASTSGGAADTNVTKTGEGTLVFSETGWLETDNLIIAEGGLEFQGGASNNRAYSVAMEGGELTLREGSGFTIAEDGVHDGSLVGNGGSINLDKGSVLDVAGDVELNDGFDGLSGEGSLKLGGTLTGSDKLDGINLGLGSASVVTVDGDGNIASVNGSGDLKAAGGTLTVDGTEDSFFSGSMVGGTAPGTLVIGNGGGTFTYKAPANGGSHDWNLVNKAQDHATVFDLRRSDGANNTLTLGSLNLADNSGTVFKVHGDDLANGGTFVDLTSLEVGDGANITINADGDSLINSGVIVLGNAGSLATGDAYTVNLEGDVFAKLASTATLDVINGQLVLRTTASAVNKLAPIAASHNAQAGATLLWDSVAPAGGDLEKAFNAVYAQAAAGDTATANKAMASVAGSSISALGMAFSGDVDRQLRAIRNRTTTMGVDPCYVREDMPYLNAWVNAEGDYRKMDADGTAAGYTLSSWGGTLGFDVDVTPKFTMGLAMTAMYGDFDSDAPDQATGDFDTYYVSLFARYAAHRWTHTFVGTIGRADASLKRTVDYGAGSYKTEGDTVGLGFGLMYEVGYVIPVNEESSACFQPVFNITWRHAGIDGYNESGSDAALHAGSQTVDVVTLGLGARVQAAVGENIYNRTALLEARALLKADIGDRKSDLDVSVPGAAANIESAELGAVGVELGAGLSVPVGAEGGVLFIDGSAELRSGYANVNGTVGYRINF